MKELSVVVSLIKKVWSDPLNSELPAKKIDVSKYKELSRKIPDKYLNIEEVYSKNELGSIWVNFEPYLNKYKIFPFLSTIGETVICIGYGEENIGKIYYFDFDFGCQPIDESLDEFIIKLVEK